MHFNISLNDEYFEIEIERNGQSELAAVLQLGILLYPALVKMSSKEYEQVVVESAQLRMELCCYQLCRNNVVVHVQVSLGSVVVGQKAVEQSKLQTCPFRYFIVDHEAKGVRVVVVLRETESVPQRQILVCAATVGYLQFQTFLNHLVLVVQYCEVYLGLKGRLLRCQQRYTRETLTDAQRTLRTCPAHPSPL